MIRVGVLGAAGRMGRLVCQAVAEDSDLALVAGINPSFDGEHLGRMIGHPEVDVRISDGVETLLQAETEVAVDFTEPDVVMDNVRWAIEHAMHIVVGTTGVGPKEQAEIAQLLEDEGNESNVVVAPNFAIGAVLMMQAARMVAPHMRECEIVELHHDRKLDAPSGTAARTADLIRDAGGNVHEPIHSVRLPGLVAHHEVLFGGVGQTLSIRHDSISRESFIPGVLLAVRRVADLERSPTIGLENLL